MDGLGGRIVQRLREIGMSQAELARRVGVTQSAINHLIRRGGSGSSHIHKIARVLETTAEFLSGETEDSSLDAPLPVPQISPEEMDFVQKLRRLSPSDRESIKRLTKSLGRAPD